MDLRLYAAIFVGKLIAVINKLLGTGATAAPGLYALKIDPNLVKKLSKNIKAGSIIISGTNGKTTTSRLISDILSTKYKVIHNRQGSNLLRGIASTMITRSSILGKIDADIAIWEVDEATLAQAIDNTSPKTVTLLNLFRDQLDRYGEVDTTRNKWQKALAKVNEHATLILNADDPGISYLSESFRGKVIYFGVSDNEINLPQIAHIADIKFCPRCNSSLNYSALLSGHMGHYACPKCNFRRPNPQIVAQDLEFKKDFSTKLSLTIHHSPFTIHHSLPGLYNVYNILAATSIAESKGINAKQVKTSIEKFSTAFGRYQKITIGTKKVILFLIKNPTGANEVLRTLALNQNLNILVILNDNFADGQDVSWIWDTNWEILKPKTKNISISGTRAWDMATRLKYAGYKLSKDSVYREVSYSILDSLKSMNNNDTLLILPTYTALLKVQKTLSKLTKSTKWHQQ